MRLIDAEALLKILELGTDGYHTETQYTMGFLDGKKQAMEVIYDMPTIDAEPVKHGRWILTEYARYCSHCGANIDPDDNADAFRFCYCPYCGARMDEVQNEAD